MTELERLSYIDHRVTITLIGDPSKTVLMPLWASRTEIPGAWSTQLDVNHTRVIGIIWDIMMDSIVHIFPSDSVDHTILFYDMGLRKTDMRACKYSMSDYLKHITDMKGSYKSTTCIIIAENDPVRGEVIRSCKQKGIKDIYILNNTGKDIASLKPLVSDLVTRVYKTRRDKANLQLREYLKKTQDG